MLSLFNVKYPIIAAAMNQVSDLKLALACADAGIVASLSSFNYIDEDKGKIDFENLSSDLKKFVSKTKSKNLILSLSDELLKESEIIDIINESNFGAIEITAWTPPGLKFLDSISSPILLKTNGGRFYRDIKDQVSSRVDAIILKGSDGAGTVNPENRSSLKDLFCSMKIQHHDISIIPSGGIGTSSQVKEYLDLGAEYISIGTLFAFSLESSISVNTKNRIVESSRKDISFLNNSYQNAIKFGSIDKKDNLNNTESLKHGILNSDKGHVFVGTSVDYINEIESVNTIVKRLIKDLDL